MRKKFNNSLNNASILKGLVVAGMLLVGAINNSNGASLKNVISLSGNWAFSLGDDISWSQPKANDKDWDNIKAPSSWEKQGYVGYDGYAWYRKTVVVPEINSGRTVILQISNIDDADEVYFNGVLIGHTGLFPPKFETAYNWDRKYIIPNNLIKANRDNLVAIRVYDEGSDGGIVSGPIRICIDEDEEYLSLNLAGLWKFKFYDNNNWKTPEYDDSKWEELNVPMSWESQGHFTYDGFAWYRKTFVMPADLRNKKLYLSMGRVDDYDQVYFNGQLIGEVSNKKKKSLLNKSFRGCWHIKRVYEIPKELIKETNVIAIRVYDEALTGGIYEGPIGIMDENNFKSYKEKSDSFYDEGDNIYTIGDFFRNFFEYLFE